VLLFEARYRSIIGLPEEMLPFRLLLNKKRRLFLVKVEEAPLPVP
jgi:hypothetical protein